MPLTPIAQYSNKIVQPMFEGSEIIELPVALKASTTFPAGTVIGELLGTIDVQTLHQTAALTAGSYTVSDGVNTSPSVQFNAVAADVQAALNSALPGPIIYNVVGGPLSGGSPVDFTLTRQAAGVQATLTLVQTGVTGGTLSVVHTTSGTAPANGVYGPYASGNSDGTQNPRGILRYGATTDSAGNITMGGDVTGATSLYAPMCVAGAFRIQDLVGLDATAVTRLGARIIEGAVASNGIIILPGI